MAALLWHPLSSHKPSMKVKASWAPPIYILNGNRHKILQKVVSSLSVMSVSCAQVAVLKHSSTILGLLILSATSSIRFPKIWRRVDLDVPHRAKPPTLSTLTSGKTLGQPPASAKRGVSDKGWQITWCSWDKISMQPRSVLILDYPVSLLRLQMPTTTPA